MSMAVKDLVGLFDSPPSGSEREGTHVSGRPSTIWSPPRDLPPSSPARFIYPRRLSRRLSSTEPIPLHAIHEPFMTNDTTTPHDSSALMDEALNISTDVVEELNQGTGATKLHRPSLQENASQKVKGFGQNSGPASSEQELEGLLPPGGSVPSNSVAVVTSPPTPAPQREVSSTSMIGPRRNFRPHTPIPATIVFAPDAVPLFLPKLDQHIASLPLPSFLPAVIKEKDLGSSMFSPMDRLVASQRSVEDLENNSGVVPRWRSRRSILSALVNMMLGFLVCFISWVIADNLNVLAAGIQCAFNVLQFTRSFQYGSDFRFDFEHNWSVAIPLVSFSMLRPPFSACGRSSRKQVAKAIPWHYVNMSIAHLDCRRTNTSPQTKRFGAELCFYLGTIVIISAVIHGHLLRLALLFPPFCYTI